MDVRNKVVLVTGASGFVGTYVCQRLIAEGARVRALVRRPEAVPEVERLGAETVLGDITDARVQEAAVRGAHVVVHGAFSDASDLAEARRVNAEATGRLAEAALAAGCERFVHISTVAVYPTREREGAVDETSPLLVEGETYPQTKAEAERALNAVMARGLEAVLLRPAVILGVHPSSIWGSRIPAAIAAGHFPQVDGGRPRFGYVHITSLAEAVVLALRVDAAVGEAFNIVDGHASWNQYTQAFRKGPLPELPPDQAPEFLSFRGSFPTDKARRVLGFEPRECFESSMEEILRALPRP